MELIILILAIALILGLIIRKRGDNTMQTNTSTDRRATANSTFAIGGVSCSADCFVVAKSSVLRISICAEKPAHRKSANR